MIIQFNSIQFWFISVPILQPEGQLQKQYNTNNNGQRTGQKWNRHNKNKETKEFLNNLLENLNYINENNVTSRCDDDSMQFNSIIIH
jgi:hypothetical protein